MLWGVVPLEAHGDTVRFIGREGFIERGPGVGVEVVLHQDDFFSAGEVDAGDVPEHMGIINGGAAIGDLHVPPSLQWGETHEEVGGAIAFVFIIEACGFALLHRQRNPGFAGQLLAGLVQAYERAGRVTGAGVYFQHILHRRDKGAVRLGRDDPLLPQMRLECVFFSARPTVL